MARTQSKNRRKAAPTARRKKRSPKAQSLLIVHFDAPTLRSQRLHLGELAEFAAIASAIGSGAQVTLLDVGDEADLLHKFAGAAQAGKTFDVIVAVGHSSATGIKIASNHTSVTTWPAFANYLELFRPRRLFLVACKGGRWDAGEALFNALPDLRRIYACPVMASREFGALMLFAVPYVVWERQPKDKAVAWLQTAAVALTGDQLREWRRTTDKGKPDRAVLDVIADFFDPFAKQVPDALRTLLGRKP